MYRIEKQVIRLVPQERVLEPYAEQRGSIEETQRILREIERINQAMGYRKKQEVAFPRKQNFHEGYFFPRPVYQPLNFQTTISPGPMFKQFEAEELVSSSDPFRNQVYYYPAPYLHLPLPDSPRSFQHQYIAPVKQSKELTPRIYVLPISVPSADGRTSEIRYVPSTIDFSTLDVFKRKAKVSLDKTGEKQKRKIKKGKGVVDDITEVVGEDKIEEELLEEMLEAVDYELEDDEEDKQEKTTETPVLPNDKFLNNKFLTTSGSSEDEMEHDVEMMILNKGPGGTARSFNISATFQNFTNRFIPSTPAPNAVLAEIKDLKENPDTKDGDVIQEKGPFGIFNRQVEPPNGGLVIQRLRVRQGGIAIAGPGGVATAGSGGTAIVGPNGTAITHPRSLTIAGPGAKIYAVPESVDLGQTINATKRSLPMDAVLVASGPVVYYRN
ncbi:uncharacterized protein LOC129767556 isoform X3 [Toxorhynchites rutilus septentrionalis]|uniref:uncharacterized protein LOC129767556 isoform X3 n=1 Tax=Toxorhynchites rutilus septentrionalis TaxID=329112 RepID=UPI002478D970|nr:uncharacterized protein LOC129767556 isoform X3 [Toxorhynchites rutilus septentrionalis]